MRHDDSISVAKPGKFGIFIHSDNDSGSDKIRMTIYAEQKSEPPQHIRLSHLANLCELGLEYRGLTSGSRIIRETPNGVTLDIHLTMQVNGFTDQETREMLEKEANLEGNLHSFKQLEDHYKHSLQVAQMPLIQITVSRKKDGDYFVSKFV